MQPAMRRRIVITLASFAAALALYAAAGFAGLPALGRSQLPGLLSQALGRTVTIGDIEFNPFTLRAVVTGLRVAERGAGNEPPALAFARLELDGSWQSLTELAPVISGVRLVDPHLRLVRASDGRYSIDDLIAKWSKPTDPNEPKARFSVANIELHGGRIDFDDLPLPRSHKIAQIEIQVPFLSSLPVHQSVTVQPRLAMTINDTRIDLAGRSRPFSETRESTLDLSLSPIDLTPYVAYVPGSLPVKVMGAVLAGKASVEFAQPPGAVPSVTVRADLGLTKLDLREPGGEPLLSLAELRLKTLVLEPLLRRAELGAIEIDAPVLHVQRRSDQQRFFQAVLDAGGPKAEPGRQPDIPAAPPEAAARWAVDAVSVKGGRVAFQDGRFEPRALAVTLDDVTLTTGRLSSDPAASLPFQFGFTADGGERVQAGGTFSPNPLRVEAKVEVKDVTLNRWWWIAQPYLQADVSEGVLQLQTGLKVDQSGDQFRVRLEAVSADLKSLVLRQRWDKRDLLRLPAVSLSGTDLDLAGRTVSVGQLTLAGGLLNVLRAADGQTNLARAFTAPVSAPAAADARATPDAPAARTVPTSPGPSPAASPPVAPAAATPAGGDTSWRYTLKRVAVERFAASVRDAGASGGPATEAAAKAGAIDLADLGLQIDDLGNARDSRGKLTLRTRVGSAGSLELRGALGLNPVIARLRVDAKSIGVLPAQPYFAPYVNLVVGSGSLSTQGDLGVDLPDPGALRAAYRGDVTLADFAAAVKGGGDDLLRWKSLSLGSVDFALTPLKIDVGQVALADFYTRLIIGPDGRFNLQDLAAGAPAPSSPPAAAPALPAASAGATAVPAASPPATPVPSGPPLPVRIGRVTLSNGNIDFTDLFVRPNYSANLTGMTGAISALAPDTAGDVELRGRVDNAGSVEITGKINPLAASLALDLTARARDIDLPRTSPYSVKYLGYGIEKGKLSANLKYKIEGRKLQSENSIVLDQLTFGEKVDSATATKLPVLFAVALLKDRNGVIDVNLPIGGSLDDPEFSVGGLVLRIIFNLIVKAVTAPFTLLAGLAGSGEELSQLEFGPGLARLEPAIENRLKALAKALADRPALRLDLAGRADPDKDGEALRKRAFERRLKSVKLRATGIASPPGGLDAVTIDPAEYPKYLLAAYRAGEFPKPRTAGGALAEVPPADMEKLLMAHTAPGPDELRDLANARAQAAKEWLATQGAIAGERMFVVAPRLNAEGVAAGASASRVDLSLK